MTYPASMQESIRRLEATRMARMQQVIPRMSLEERYELIANYHPDARKGAMCPLRIGPNKGDQVPVELADLLEAHSSIDPETFDLEHIDYDVDVLIIGGGGGGSAAALSAQEEGGRVLLATKLRHGDSNTIMAEGGIAAATHKDDSPVFHYVDTMGGGRFKNIPDLVEALVLDAPLIVKWLTELGVMFDKEPDGTLICSFAGGHSWRRVHSCKDYSGMEIMRVLRDEIQSRQIPVLEFSPAVELLTDDQGRCTGAILLNLETSAHEVVRAKCVILATGGIGRLHVQGFPTTNHYGATADGCVLGYRAGARLIYMDYIQYHPTGAVWPEQTIGWLITEALRGNGAHLVNVHGQRYINELETRDTVSAANIRECGERGNGVSTPAGHVGIWLDTPMIDMLHGEGTFHRLFAGIERRFELYGIDPTVEPLLVYPTQHYQNGGLLHDVYGRTNVPNLYVAGEGGGGVQGHNRLGGNSLADIFVFGRRAGWHASETAREITPSQLTLQHVRKYHRALTAAGIESARVSPILLPDYSRPGIRRF